MKLIDGWKHVLTGSASILMIVASLISMGGVFLSLVTAETLGLDPIPFAVLSALFSVLAIPARLVLQSGLSDAIARFRSDTAGAVRNRVVGGLAAGGVGLAAAVAFIGDWEGLRTEAYQDIVGVWTVCYGETKGVRPGDSYTVGQCDEMLRAEILEYEAALDECLEADVPIGAKIAFVSWTYNVGSGAACRSTLIRKANAGDLRGACDELPRWSRAGGRIIKGLSNRRAAERALCLKSIEAET